MVTCKIKHLQNIYKNGLELSTSRGSKTVQQQYTDTHNHCLLNQQCHSKQHAVQKNVKTLLCDRVFVKSISKTIKKISATTAPRVKALSGLLDSGMLHHGSSFHWVGETSLSKTIAFTCPIGFRALQGLKTTARLGSARPTFCLKFSGLARFRPAKVKSPARSGSPSK